MIRLQWLTKKNLAKAFPRNTPGGCRKTADFHNIYAGCFTNPALYCGNAKFYDSLRFCRLSSANFCRYAVSTSTRHVFLKQAIPKGRISRSTKHGHPSAPPSNKKKRRIAVPIFRFAPSYRRIAASIHFPTSQIEEYILPKSALLTLWPPHRHKYKPCCFCPLA